MRLNCLYCKEPFEVPDSDLRALGEALSLLHGKTLYKGRGCDQCLGRGLYDRTALYEILQVDETVRDQIIARTSASVIKQAAVQSGALSTLRHDGLLKVAEGRTTLEEVYRVTQLDVF